MGGSVMGVFLTGGYIFQTLGLERTTASNTGFITGLFVVLTPVLGAIFLRQRIPLVAWGAAALAMLGLWLLAGAGTHFNMRGDGLVLVCAFALAPTAIVAVEIIPRFRPPRPLPEG